VIVDLSPHNRAADTVFCGSEFIREMGRATQMRRLYYHRE
jgi:hypothetical protein